ncbi:hypothetical protein [Roseicyclus mahoneyensis]|uniref:hypothetical protein n=1 Tax=Roseicyclus mahoneyensis TaxID=164332 RepID=UPI001B874B47|nr:hypothetical protein [Roseicyclus mahoneyensis]
MTLLEKESQMPKENPAELFIRVLMEEFENLRVLRKFGFPSQYKAQPKRFRQFSKNDQADCRGRTEPLDCLQLMSTAGQPRTAQLFETQ